MCFCMRKIYILFISRYKIIKIFLIIIKYIMISTNIHIGKSTREREIPIEKLLASFI